MKRAAAALSMLALLTAAGDEDRAIRVTVTAADGGTLRAGSPARIKVSARDPASGFALNGLTPAFWLVPDDNDTARAGCERLVNRLAASAVVPEGTVDLNGFDVLQATREGRIALVDPLLNLASANIKAILDVGAVPVGWSLDTGGRTLAVATAADRTVSIVDMSRFAVAHRVRLDAEPVALIDGGAGFWVGFANGSVTAIAHDGTKGAVLKLGDGAVSLSAAGDGIVALARSGDGAFLRPGREPVLFAIGSPVTGATFAPLADSLFALGADGKTIFTVQQDHPGAPSRIPLEQPAASLTLDPNGRWLAAVSTDGLAVTIVDVARSRPRWTVTVKDPIIAADFSDAFLYLVHAHQGGATRVVFDPAGGPPGVVTIAAGSSRDGEQSAGNLPIMARIPQAGMLVASSRDRSAYMINDDNAQAAMSSLPLRAGEPAGILLRYRGLAPSAERGDYRAEVVVPRGGRYVAVVRTEQPGIAHCTRVTFASVSGEAPISVAAAIKPVERRLLTSGQIAPGPQVIRFAISGAPAAELKGATIVGDGWQFTPPDVTSGQSGYTMPVDFPPGRAFTLFVQYRDAAGSGILSAPVQVASK